MFGVWCEWVCLHRVDMFGRFLYELLECTLQVGIPQRQLIAPTCPPTDKQLPRHNHEKDHEENIGDKLR